MRISRLWPLSRAATVAVFTLLACAGPPLLEGKAGRDLAPLRLEGLAGGEGYGHLGLQSGQSFRLADVSGELLVLELFNSHCPACRVLSGDLQKLYETVTAAAGFRSVRVLAVGLGDREEDLVAFRDSHRLTYPMASDPGYLAYEQLGAMTGTPTILFLNRGNGSGWRVAGVLRGLHDSDVLLAEVQRVRVGGGAAPDVAMDLARFDPPLGLDAVERERRVLSLFQRVDPRVASARQIELGPGEQAFRAFGASGEGLELFARIASRNPPCDVCHSTHLAVAFDRGGVVLGLDLIHAPKAGNIPFAERERDALQAHLVGRTMAEVRYDPAVDAVTAATITTGVIYDEVRRTAALLPRMP